MTAGKRLNVVPLMVEHKLRNGQSYATLQINSVHMSFDEKRRYINGVYNKGRGFCISTCDNNGASPLSKAVRVRGHPETLEPPSWVVSGYAYLIAFALLQPSVHSPRAGTALYIVPAELA